MAPRRLPMATEFLSDIIREEDGRWKFATVGKEDVRTDALTLSRYRLHTMPTIRRPGRDARRMSLSDSMELRR